MTSRVSVPRGRPASIVVDGAQVAAYAGETVAAAMLAAGIDAFHTDRLGEPRAPLCNMGTCYECVVRVEGAGQVRACLTPVCDGMQVSTDD